MLELFVFIILAVVVLWALQTLVALPQPIYVLLVVFVVVIALLLLIGAVGDLDGELGNSR